MEEIKRVINYRKSVLGTAGGKVLAICLSSRSNLISIIHPNLTMCLQKEYVRSSKSGRTRG